MERAPALVDDRIMETTFVRGEQYVRNVERAPSGRLWRKLTQGIALSLSLTLTGVPAIPAFQGTAAAAVDARTISMYFPHTKESIKITYKRGGRYDKAALKKINYFLRDWRAKKPTRMDPKLIDLLWELHRELGSKKPVHVISAFRSASTNKRLKKIGRNVARRSMHIQGKAIDVYFPDVKVKRLRESALLRERGGVGYYPRSGKHGFVHIDTGTVRHWPRMSKQQLAKLFRNKKKRRNTTPSRPVLVAKSSEPASDRTAPNAFQVGEQKPVSVRLAKAKVASTKPAKARIASAKRARIPRPRLNPNRDTDIQLDSAQLQTIVAKALAPSPQPRSRPVELAEAPLPPAAVAPQIQAALDSTAPLDEPVAIERQQSNPVLRAPVPPVIAAPAPVDPEPVAPVVVANARPDRQPVIIEPAAVSPYREPSNIVAERPSPARGGLRVGSNSRVVSASTSPVVDLPGEKNRSFWQTLFPNWFRSADDNDSAPVETASGTRVASLNPGTIVDDGDDITTASIANSSSHGKTPIVNRPGKADRLYAVPMAQLAVIELPGNRQILMNRGKKADSLVPVQDRQFPGRPRAAVTPASLGSSDIPQLRTSKLEALGETGSDTTSALPEAASSSQILSSSVPTPRVNPKREWLKVNLDPIRRLIQ